MSGFSTVTVGIPGNPPVYTKNPYVFPIVSLISLLNCKLFPLLKVITSLISSPFNSAIKVVLPTFLEVISQ